MPAGSRAGALALAAVTGIAGLGLWTAPAARAGATAPGAAERTLTFEVAARGEVSSDLGTFARVAAATLNDRRGWSLGGAVAFRQVTGGGDFTLWLAAPGAMASFSPRCSPSFSCRAGRDVVVNDERWRTGTATWPHVAAYRRYVLNHEVGHWLGLGHRGCPGAGAPAPVMQQQSKDLGGCTASAWPTADERERAAGDAGVQVRPSAPVLYTAAPAASGATRVRALDPATGYATALLDAVLPADLAGGGPWAFAVADHDRDGAPDLYAVDHAGPTGTEVHVLAGANGLGSTRLATPTALGPTEAAGWVFAVADHDGDGHQDLYAIDRRPGAGAVSVHVLDGADGFASWLAHARTHLPAVGAAEGTYLVGDQDGDGRPDVLAVRYRGASGRAEVEVAGGSGGYTQVTAGALTPLVVADPAAWSVLAADTDGDGADQLVAVSRTQATAELHVLGGGLDRWVAHHVTGEAATGGASWSAGAG